MTIDDYETVAHLKLSAQRALLGNITENMAAVVVELSAMCITLTFLLFHDVGEDDKEHGEDAASEVIADHPEGYTIQTRYERFIGMGDSTTGTTKHLVYLRSRGGL